MIAYGPARSKALYAFECDDLAKRRGVVRITRGNLRAYLPNFWGALRETSPLPKAPAVTLGAPLPYAYCCGCSEIVLPPEFCNTLYLAHELTHAARFGSAGNPHSPGFVRRYLALLAVVHGWETGELELSAISRGLL